MLLLLGLLLAAPTATARSAAPEETPPLDTNPAVTCPAVDPGAAPLPTSFTDPSLLQRLLKYTQVSVRHRISGLASYYSSFFDGRQTANGEIYRNKRYSAAHLTLPLGCWVEVTARATGRKLRLRVNDRGPYARKFCLDLSQAAAQYLGVDTARDRYVDIRIIALPGEDPLPEDVDWSVIADSPVVTAGSR
ncbi:MAG: rare lipoprotein [Acidobacteriota bacterium]|jgi:rare lipoprotein A|nr:rare lipoprotein [Acidobacteriota bacterium]